MNIKAHGLRSLPLWVLQCDSFDQIKGLHFLPEGKRVQHSDSNLHRPIGVSIILFRYKMKIGARFHIVCHEPNRLKRLRSSPWCCWVFGLNHGNGLGQKPKHTDSIWHRPVDLTVFKLIDSMDFGLSLCDEFSR